MISETIDNKKIVSSMKFMFKNFKILSCGADGETRRIRIRRGKSRTEERKGLEMSL